MRYETRIRRNGKVGRIKVLAANPRTARGFSGDLILDEFAFHENARAIWEAVEPILAANPGYLCRIASTPNGPGNLFHEMVTGGLYAVRRVRRSDAWREGMAVYDPVTREAITPAQARARAHDQAAYDQNYECEFHAVTGALLSPELIATACEDKCGEVCEGTWSASALERLGGSLGSLSVGVDVGRHHDLTVISVLETLGPLRYLRAVLRLRQTRLPAQQEELLRVCALRQFHAASIDITGLGLGLCEYSQQRHGSSRIHGVHFGSQVPLDPLLAAREGRAGEKVPVTEALAVGLLRSLELRELRLIDEAVLRADLQKPARRVSAAGRVMIAAARNGEGHADHFWSLALALEASRDAPPLAGPTNACEPLGSLQRTPRLRLA